MSETILSRASLSNPAGAYSHRPQLTPFQSQVDQLVGGFIHQATDWKSLAALVAGGIGYRVGRVAVMSYGSRVTGEGIVLSSLIRGGSVCVRSGNGGNGV